MAATRTRIALCAVFGASCSDFSVDDFDQGSTATVIVEETFLQNPSPRVDLLWMVDNTLSMATEHTRLLSQVEPFLIALETEGVSWHIGVITPDGSGVLEGNPWVLTPTNTTSETLTQTLSVGLDGALPQTGLAAINRALTPPLSSTANRGFRRDNASLHVLVYSDGDDQSEDLLGPDATEVITELLASERERTGLTALFSAIVGPTPMGCIDSFGGATAGSIYIATAEQNGGTVHNICDHQLDTIAQEVADVSRTLSVRFTLQAAPNPDSMRVAINGARADDGWRIEEQDIVFETPPDFGATISIRYEVGEP